jgi:hypothetical protein
MLEQEQDDVIPDQGDPVDGTIDLAKELFDKIKKDTGGFSGRIKLNYPDGSSGYEELYCQDRDHNGPKKYRLGLWLYYYPNDNTPIIPNDLFTHGIKEMINFIFEVFPEIKSYSKEVMDEFTFTLGNDTVYYKEGIMHVTNTNILPSAERNVLLGNYPLWELVHRTDDLINTYYLENPPKFSDDYALAMDKAIKKLKTVWMALKKGTFKGVEYEYMSKPTYVVHQKLNNYNKETRVIYPEFSLSISSGWARIDGKPVNQIEDKELFDEFHEFISKKFNHFGINLS